jgi:HNH endonuclease
MGGIGSGLVVHLRLHIRKAETLMILEYKTVRDWPMYEISNLGGVRRDNKPIAQFLNNRGYLCFNVSDGSKRKMLRVHREVARAFLPQTGPIVRHLDGNKLNCCLSNLAWGNSLDNESDKNKHGRTLRRARHPMAKLTEANVTFILVSQQPAQHLAEVFGVTKRHIWAIKTGRAWS